MRTVKLEVRSLDDLLADFSRAWARNETDDCARIAFASPELLWRVLTARRWALLKVMAGAGPLSIREAPRRVERDVKAVHADVHALLDARVVNKAGAGEIEFPYDAVHLDFTLYAAA